MGDSEAVVTQTSGVVGYTYSSTEYVDTSSTAVPDAAAFASVDNRALAGSAAPGDAVYAMADGSNVGEGHAYGTNPNTVMQEAPGGVMYEAPSAGAADTGSNLAAAESSQAAGYDTSVNGNASTEARNFPSVENGNAPDVGGAAVEPHFEEGSGMLVPDLCFRCIFDNYWLGFFVCLLIHMIHYTERTIKQKVVNYRR